MGAFLPQILTDIDKATDAGELFDILCAYFRDQGCSVLAYIAPEGPTAPFVVMDRGMPEGWADTQRRLARTGANPFPGISIRLGRAASFQELIDLMPALRVPEQAFIEAAREAPATPRNAIIIPAFGPFCRPAVVSLVPDRPEVPDQIDLPMAAAVVQQYHTKAELLQFDEPPPPLSPRERDILALLLKGNANSQISAALGIAEPTVATHMKRIYHKLGVNDRATCIAKALAYRYL